MDPFRSLAIRAVRWCVVLLLAPVLLAVSGCGKQGPPIEGRRAIEGVARWYQLYRADHGGKVPPNEDAFVAFIERKLQERGDTLNPDELLTSPRDKQKYVIQYGNPPVDKGAQTVAVYEQEGYRGKKLVGFESGAYVNSRELDEAELQSLLGEQ